MVRSVLGLFRRLIFYGDVCFGGKYSIYGEVCLFWRLILFYGEVLYMVRSVCFGG